MSQVDVTLEDDIYELDTPFVVLTDKLKNVSYHVNNISDTITTDSTVIHTSVAQHHSVVFAAPVHTWICQEIFFKITHLSRVIKSSQERRSFLSSLLTNIQGESFDVPTYAPCSAADASASDVPVLDCHDASK